MSLKIVALKLLSGEDIISAGEITPEGRFKLVRPVCVMQTPASVPGAPPSLAFIPFPTYADHSKNEPLLIEPLHVVYTYTADKEMCDEYISMLDGKPNEPVSTNQIITG